MWFEVDGMTRSEVIDKLELLKAEIEWDKNIEYQIVIDEAIRYISNPLPDFDCAMRE